MFTFLSAGRAMVLEKTMTRRELIKQIGTHLMIELGKKEIFATNIVSLLLTTSSATAVRSIGVSNIKNHQEIRWNLNTICY